MAIKINNVEYQLNKDLLNLTILQYCYNQNIQIPCFCYHPRLSIAGNCRMCIVQINAGLGVSCAINVADNITVYTNNKRVREARESVLEFLLINHPLDCPICDQGGECDLQDISLMFGSDRGRFYELKKRAVDNFSQNGPLIKTMMTRCIHCTRCVRFANEISSFSLGVLDRGQNMEIGTYYNIDLLDPLSGNIIDLCPVGALTSMPYAFKQRPWESSFYTNIDFLDSLASTIRVYTYSNKVVRILPLLNESLNEEWITNKSRFSYDSLIINRISYPKYNLLNKFIVISWDFALVLFCDLFNKNILNNYNILGSIGYFSDLHTSLSLKIFFNIFGSSNILYNSKKLEWIYDLQKYFGLNVLIEKLESIKFFILISCNLRLESPILNIRIKKNYLANKNNELFLYSYGLSLNYLTYPVKNVGNKVLQLISFMEGKQRFSCDLFFKYFYTFNYINYSYNLYNDIIFFLGNSIILRNDSNSFLNSFLFFLKYKFTFCSFNVINSYLGFYSYSNLMIADSYKNNKNLVGFYYLLSSNLTKIVNNAILVYQSFIKNNLYYNANLVFPTTAFYEFDSLFINLEGNYRFIKKVIKSNVYTDWEIIWLLHTFNKNTKKIKTTYYIQFFKIIRYFINIIDYVCNFYISLQLFLMHFHVKFHYDRLNKSYNDSVVLKASGKYKFINTLFNLFINNYYIMDFYTRNSKTMASSASTQYNIFKLY